jgi:hypothetical protein
MSRILRLQLRCRCLLFRGSIRYDFVRFMYYNSVSIRERPQTISFAREPNLWYIQERNTHVGLGTSDI